MFGYVVAILLTAAAVVVRFVLGEWFSISVRPFFFLFCTVAMVATWHGGFRAGLLSIALGALFWWFGEPRFGFQLERPNDQAALFAYIVTSLVGCWLVKVALAPPRRFHASQEIETPNHAGDISAESFVPINFQRNSPFFLGLGCFVVAYLLAAAFGQGLKLIPGVTITFWPSSGIFVAVLLLNDRRTWVWWVAGGCVAEMVGNALWFHNPPHLALVYFAANTAEAMTAALLVKYLVAHESRDFLPDQLESPGNAVMFGLLAGGLAPAVGATLIAAVDALSGKHAFITAWQLVWLGDGTGLLFTAPLTLAAAQVWQNRDRIPARKAFEFTATCALAMFLAWLALIGRLPTVYLALPAIVWAAVRFQIRGAWVVLAAVILTVAAYTRSGLGEFAGAPEEMHQQLIALQVFLGVCASTALIVAGLSARHVQALDRLRTANQSLERHILDRTTALWKSEERLRLAVEATGVGIFDFDPVSRRQTFSIEAMRLWGFEMGSEPSPERVLNAVHPNDRASVQATVEGSLAPNGPGRFTIEHRLIHADGTVRWVATTGRTLFIGENEQRRAIRSVGTMLDITEQKQAEEQLREADRQKDEFLATLAHELRNPLAPIRNGLQIMKLAGNDADAIARTRTVMERQLEQMVRLVDDLLDVSRITRGKVELRRQHVRLEKIVDGAVEISRHLIDQMTHHLTVTHSSADVVVDADATRLTQVFANLLNNAAKYTERGGRIWLTTECLDNHVVMSVRDTGIGIPPAFLKSIFDMFSQVDRSLEKSQGGLGIGLTLVKRLVEMHGGNIEAKSEGPGRGSEFIVRLPIVCDSSNVAAADQNPPTEPKSSLRIVIVDDNADGADTLSMMLTILGNETHTAYDGQAGVELAERIRPDVILFDIGLPKLNGYEASQRIREQHWGKAIILIALTGLGQDEDRRRSRHAGFDHHLVKPVDPTELMKLLIETNATKRRILELPLRNDS